MKNRQNRLLHQSVSIAFLLGAIMLFMANNQIKAQNVSTYSFDQTSGTYTPISGGTSVLAGSLDDDISTLTNIGFSFVYHGVAYTQFAAESNGYIVLGATTTSTSPLSAVPNAIAFAGGDGKTNADVIYLLSGTAPNRVLTIQYPNWYIYYSSTSETLNAQIKLYETSNVEQIVYGSSTRSSSYTRQVGLTGAAVTDFNNRTTTSNWATTTSGGTNTATITWSSSVFPASGQTYTWTPPDPCSGMPAPGNTLATATSVCPTIPFTLSLSNTTSFSGMTYQWQSSTDDATWTNIAGATSASYTTSQSVATFYRCLLTCTNGGQTESSSSLNVTMNTPTSCYCASTATSTSDEDILNVTFGTLNNTSTCSTTGGAGSILNEYSDYTVVVAPNVQQGSSVAFSVQVGTCGGNYSNACTIWIDYNNNGDFSDVGEKVYSSAATTSGPHIETGNIIIPIYAKVGLTRMRVICQESSIPSNPCGTYSYGETEDYQVNITLAPPCAGTPTGGTVASVPTADCSGGVLTVTGSTVASGLTYQWQSSPTGSNPWTNIAGATDYSYTTTAFGLYYRRVVVCTSSGLSDNSTSILLNSSAPSNDDCSNAVLLPVSATSACASVVSGTVSCASASSQTNSCSGTADDDVWYQFVATSGAQKITLSNVVGDETDMAMGLYSGTCGSLTNVLCSDQNVVTASDLTIGNTYYIRVFTYTSTTGQNTTFDICVSTPDEGSICDFAQPFCTGTTYNFPAGVGTGTGEVGPNYGCLSNTPNPVWYFLKVSGSGPIEIYMYGDASEDVDFACWGPFNSPATPCTAELTAGDDTPTHSVAGASSDYPSVNMIDCSFDSQEMEWCYIPNPQIGEYYVLLITNYSNQYQNIVFSQSSGSGATDCSIIAPPITDNGPLCEGQTLLLNANDSVAGATYSWTGPNGFALTTSDPSITIANVTVANAGVYSLVVYNANDTSDVVTDTVVIHSYPIATITNNSGTTVLTCNSTSINATTGVGDAYVWSGGATATVAVNTFTAPGTYVVTVTNGGLCASTDSITITQDTLWPVAIINNPGGTTELTCVINSISVMAGTGDSYAWSGGGTPSTAANSFTLPGVYTVTVSTSNGCTATSSITIIQQAQVTLSLLSMVPDHCAQGIGEATVIATGGSGAYTFTWDGTEIPQESNGIDHATNLYAGTYSVEVADGPCVNNLTVTVSNIPGPIASFEPFPAVVFSSNPEFRFLNKSTNGYNQTMNGYDYSWSFGDGAISTIESPTHLYNGEVANFIVFMEVTDDFGCKDSISQMVSIIEDLKIFVPNSFTPDGDGLNDVFKPSGVGFQEKGYEMVIFDRWGKQVFVSNQFDKGWDGTIEGEKVTTSFVFFYRIEIIDLKGFKSKFNGKITLVGSKSGSR